MINVLRNDLAARQRKIVASFFIRQPEITARLFPLSPVRRDPAPSRPVMREEMRQLMPQRLVDFRVAKLRELRVQRDE